MQGTEANHLLKQLNNLLNGLKIMKTLKNQKKKNSPEGSRKGNGEVKSGNLKPKTPLKERHEPR